MSFTEDLFIFELANNHQGSLSQGKSIIDMCSHLAKKYSLPQAGIMIPLRNLETLIHPEAKENENSFVKQLLSTQLSLNEQKELAQYAKEKELKTIATVFDEDSIALFKEINFDFLKIASSSYDDFPLLCELSKLNKPTIVSTGGATRDEINRAVLALKKKPLELAIVHTVDIYPTNDEELCLNQIKVLKEEFPEYSIGFSTHENSDSIFPISQCVSLGCRIFEKHVALETEDNKKNAYSADATQLEIWLATYTLAKNTLNNDKGHVARVKAKERESLGKLKRGVFEINEKKVFAYPKNEGGKDVSSLYLAELSKESRFFHQQFERATSHLRAVGLTPVLTSKVSFSFKGGLENFNKTGALYFYLFEDDKFLKRWTVMESGQSTSENQLGGGTLLKLLHGECKIRTREGSENDIGPGDYYSLKSGETYTIEATSSVVIEEVITKDKDQSIQREKEGTKSFALKNGFLEETSL